MGKGSRNRAKRRLEDGWEIVIEHGEHALMPSSMQVERRLWEGVPVSFREWKSLVPDGYRWEFDALEPVDVDEESRFEVQHSRRMADRLARQAEVQPIERLREQQLRLEQLEAAQTATVGRARAEGASWREIAEVTGVTPEGARRRWGRAG